MGYVGIVTAACLTKLGHTVTGIETNNEKVAMLNNGKSPVNEPEVECIINQALSTNSFKVIPNYEDLDDDIDISFICVGTPLNINNEMSLEQVIKVTKQISQKINSSHKYHLVTLRSTVPPGTLRNIIAPILEKQTNSQYGKKYGLAFNPEFLRETTAVSDFLNPEYTIIGGIDTYASKRLDEVYKNLKGPKYLLTPEESELLKLTCNAFHALKVAFANEIGRFGENLSIDSTRVMEVFTKDKKLNISKAYLKPGFAFGGSCLPKDLKSLTAHANEIGLKLPLLEGTLTSNDLHIEHAISKIIASNPKHIGILGLGFKPNSDDVRESPSIQLVKKLAKYNIPISIYDPDINIDNMLGSNLDYLKAQIPNISSIICKDIDEILAESSTIVITQNRNEFAKISTPKIIINLVKPS